MTASPRTSSPRLPAATTAASIAAALLLLYALSTYRAPAAAPTTGTYTVHFGGCATGQGVATVSAKAVSINANVIDSVGATLPFIAADLKLTGTRFKGTGTFGDTPISISGRIDVSDSLSSKARIQATFIADGEAGRIVGPHD